MLDAGVNRELKGPVQSRRPRVVDFDTTVVVHGPTQGSRVSRTVCRVQEAESTDTVRRGVWVVGVGFPGSRGRRRAVTGTLTLTWKQDRLEVGGGVEGTFDLAPVSSFRGVFRSRPGFRFAYFQPDEPTSVIYSGRSRDDPQVLGAVCESESTW